MSDKELVTTIISQYMALLRIEKAESKEKEIGNQKRELRVKLESLGVAVEDLTID